MELCNMLRISKLMLISSLFLTSMGLAEVRLPKFLNSNMIVQRKKPINIWGWAGTDEKVTVSFAGKSATATADSSGKWLVSLPAQKANATGQDLVVKGSNEITLKNVIIGDIWIGSGQSNMEWTMNQTQKSGIYKSKANHPNIRLLHVPRVKKGSPQDDLNASWKVCTPASVGGFSGVLYHFGRQIEKEIGVPLGLIHTAWGGSPIEPWHVNGGMYNAMIAPLHNMNLKGFTWYQGESNVKNGLAYHDKKKTLIEGWRQKWKDDKLPFYYVQIAPWANYGGGQLPRLWEGQCKSLSIPFTGMAVTTDLVHNIGDIHPVNKYDVGQRLARWALAKDYGKRVVFSGPLYKSMKISGSKIIISFAHTAKGLKARSGTDLTEFKIAGADGSYVTAKAEVKGKTVVVSAESVKEPKNVQFGWHKKANPNLVNSEGLPASPFHTNGWQGATAESATNTSGMTYAALYKSDEAVREEGFETYFGEKIPEILQSAKELSETVTLAYKTARSPGTDKAGALKIYKTLNAKAMEQIPTLEKLAVLKPASSIQKLLTLQKLFSRDKKIKALVVPILEFHNTKELAALISLNKKADKILAEKATKETIDQAQVKKMMLSYKRYIAKVKGSELRAEAQNSLAQFSAASEE
jgi:sialate O-acetylesterase